MAQSNLVNKQCHISNSSKRKVLAVLTEDRSMTSIAREQNVSVNTVQRVLESCSSKFYDEFDRLLNIWLLTNLRALARSCTLSVQTAILIKQSRSLEHVLNLKFYTTSTSLLRRLVLWSKQFTMNLNCYYLIVARELFPNAQIVIDRFHIVQMLTRSFNSLRDQTMKLFKKQSRE